MVSLCHVELHLVSARRRGGALKRKKGEQMKREMWFGSACVAVCCMVGTASADVVGWWRFNGEGATVPNVASTADGLPDGTPRATDGTIMSCIHGATPVYGSDASNMPTVTDHFQQVAPRLIDQRTASGASSGTVYSGGKTLHFGADGIGGGVFVPYNAAFNLPTFTIEVFARIPAEAASRSNELFPLVQFGRDMVDGWLFAVYQGYPFVRATYTKTSDGGVQTKSSTTSKSTSYMKDMPSLFDGKWHHLALRMHNLNAGQITAEFFVDGVKCGGTTMYDWNGWYFTGDCPLAIGSQPYGVAARTFWGDIAEVRITDEMQDDNVLFVPLVKGPADDDTALLLTFDSAAKGIGFDRQYKVCCFSDATLAVQTHTNYVWWARNWNVHNAAYNNPYVPRWFPFANVYTEFGIADYYSEGLTPTLLTNDTWGDTYGIDESLFANAGSLYIPTCQPAGRAAPGTDVVNVPDPICQLPSGDFTIECVLKTEASSTTEADTFINCPFLKWCIYNNRVLARGYKNNGSGSIEDITSSSVADGNWHHAAVVYKSGVLSQYVDYKKCSLTKTNTLYVGSIGTGSRFIIGAQDRGFATGGGGAQAFRGKIDAVRITRRALTPGEFLSTRSDDKLMTVTFDDAEHPYAPGQTGAIAPNEGVAGALSGGEQPLIVPSRGGWYVMDGENGTNKVECGKAVQFAGSSLYWQNATLLERKAVTVEFFAKFTNLCNGVNLVRCVKSNAAGGTLNWSIWKTNGNLQFAVIPVKSDGTLDSQKGSNMVTGGFDGGDGVWHHWAITVDSTDGEHIVAKVYMDYEQLGNTATVKGTLDVPPLNGNRLGFSLGGTGNASAYIYGTIDQVRVSAGILPVDKFMRYDKVQSTVIYVR